MNDVENPKKENKENQKSFTALNEEQRIDYMKSRIDYDNQISRLKEQLKKLENTEADNKVLKKEVEQLLVEVGEVKEEKAKTLADINFKLGTNSQAVAAIQESLLGNEAKQLELITPLYSVEEKIDGLAATINNIKAVKKKEKTKDEA